MCNLGFRSIPRVFHTENKGEFVTSGVRRLMNKFPEFQTLVIHPKEKGAEMKIMRINNESKYGNALVRRRYLMR